MFRRQKETLWSSSVPRSVRSLQFHSKIVFSMVRSRFPEPDPDFQRVLEPDLPSQGVPEEDPPSQIHPLRGSGAPLRNFQRRICPFRGGSGAIPPSQIHLLRGSEAPFRNFRICPLRGVPEPVCKRTQDALISTYD